MKKNTSRPDPQELEQLLKELQSRRDSIGLPAEDPEYLNPWNLGKKKIRGRISVCAKLPDKLPTQE